MSTTELGTKRYNLVLPQELFDELQRYADSQHTTVAELLRRSIQLFLLAIKIAQTPGAALLIREGDTEREIILI